VTTAQRRALWGIVAVGFGLRLAWVLYARGEPPVEWFRSGDQYSYFHYGEEIARGHGYLSYISGEPTAYYPIGYPAILGALYFVVLHTPIPDNLLMATSLFHVVLGTATVWLVFRVGRAVSGVPGGLAAAAVLAIWPNAIFIAPTLLLETTFMFLVAAAVALAVGHDWQRGLPSTSRLVVVGVVLGASVLVRPFSVWLLLGLLIACRAIGASWRRTAASVAVPLLVVVVMMVPWTVRNLGAMDAFVPSSTNMGDTLCLDRSADATGGFRAAEGEGCVDPGLPEVERNAGNTRKAITFVVHRPHLEARQIVRRGRRILREDHFGLEEVQNLGGDDPLSARVVDTLTPIADGYWFGVLTLSCAGVVLLVRRRAERAQILIVLVTGAALLAVPLLLWGNPRFPAPLMPFMAVASGSAVAAAVDRLGRHRA
jgi:Dolichyl-phosphate-mannose-protein mannosyltransferase